VNNVIYWWAPEWVWTLWNKSKFVPHAGNRMPTPWSSCQ